MTKLLIDLDEVAFKAALKCEVTIFLAQEVGGTLLPSELTEDYLKRFGRLTKTDLYSEVIGDSDKDWEVQEHKISLDSSLGFKYIKEKLEWLGDKTGADEFVFCYGSGKNFRYDAAKMNPYKGDRKAKPAKLSDMVEHIRKRYRCEVMEGVESDDVMGLLQTAALTDGEETIICSQDKDLRTIPGKYLLAKDGTIKYQTPLEAVKFLYTQILMGDTTDNIRGVPGIGPRKAEKLLADCKYEMDMARVVLQAYRDASQLSVEKRTPKAKGAAVFPSAKERSPESMACEIARLVYIRKVVEDCNYPIGLFKLCGEPYGY